MTGKILAACIILAALIAGGSIYYLQVYAYYTTVAVHGSEDVMLTAQASGQPEAITYRDFQAIDSDSSPIRYRGCFTTMQSLEALAQSYLVIEKAEPRVAPGWFSCFDADRIGAALESGDAMAFMGTENIRYGIDQRARVMCGIGSIGAAKSFLRAERRPLIALNLRKVTDYA